MKDLYLTIVFKADSLSEEERSTLVEECSAASWSHAIDERNALEAEVERLQRDLNHQRLIHLGFTNNTQIEGAKQSAGSFYPSTENDNWIPVYMLVKHAHRCGRDSETFCCLLELEQENKGLRSEIEMRKLQVTGAAKVIQEEKNDNSKLREDLSAQKVISESYMSERDRYKELADERLETLADVEQERDQLKAILQQFMELNQHDRDLPLELFAIQRSVSAKAVSLADHDAEVIERMIHDHKSFFAAGNNRSLLWFAVDRVNQLRQQAKEVKS